MNRRRGIYVPKHNPTNENKQSVPKSTTTPPTVPPQPAPSAGPPPKTHHLPPKPPPKANTETSSPPPQRTSAFRSMAETAGAVAVGSTIGNVIGTSINTIILYLFGNKEDNPQSKRNTIPCAFEIDRFIACTQTSSRNLSACEQMFKEMNECKERHALNSV